MLKADAIQLDIYMLHVNTRTLCREDQLEDVCPAFCFTMPLVTEVISDSDTSSADTDAALSFSTAIFRVASAFYCSGSSWSCHEH